MGLETRIANFQAQPPREATGFAQTPPELETQLAHNPADGGGIDGIFGEGMLATHALLIAFGQDGPVINTPRNSPEVFPVGGTETVPKPLDAHGPQLRNGLDSVAGQKLCAFRAHAPQRRDRARVEEFLHAAGRHDP